MTTKRRQKKVKAEQLLDGQEEKLGLKVDIKPKGKNQENYVNSIINNEITICTGPSGSGKSLLAVNAACTALVKGVIKNIIITRPMIQCGKGLGFLTGSLSEKFDPYVSPIIEALEQILGKQTYNRLIKEKVIQIIPLELCRGKNFHQCCVIGDEMQNATYQQLVMLLTRHGQGTRTILTGDVKQTDLYHNEFSLIIDRLENLKGVGLVKLERSDIQRSGIIASILERLEDEGPVKQSWSSYGEN